MKQANRYIEKRKKSLYVRIPKGRLIDKEYQAGKNRTWHLAKRLKFSKIGDKKKHQS